MARIELSTDLFDDFERILDHLNEFEAADPPSRIDDIIAAFQVLAHSPNIGRRAKGDKRELVIGKGAKGYVALYRYIGAVDTVFILAIRAQREAGDQSTD